MWSKHWTKITQWQSVSPKLSFTWSSHFRLFKRWLNGQTLPKIHDCSIWPLFGHQTQNREHCMIVANITSNWEKWWPGHLIVEISKNLSMQLTEHKWAPRNGEVNNHIAENHYLYRRTIKSTGTLQHAISILQTTMTKENGLGLPVLLVFSTYQTSLTVPLMKLSRLGRIVGHIISTKHYNNKTCTQILVHHTGYSVYSVYSWNSFQ